MDLEIEFKKIQESQERILQLISKFNGATKDNVEIYSLEELAKLFKVTKRTIYNWKDQNKLSFIVIGSKTYVTKKQLDDFISNHEVSSYKVWRAHR